MLLKKRVGGGRGRNKQVAGNNRLFNAVLAAFHYASLKHDAESDACFSPTALGGAAIKESYPKKKKKKKEKITDNLQKCRVKLEKI